MNNYKITIQYDGTRYKGWQGQNSTGLTIQGKIEAVLGQMAGHAVEVIGSGRTDAGVHAKGQVANFHIEEHFTEGKILSYLNHYLPDDIAVIAVEQDTVQRFGICGKQLEAAILKQQLGNPVEGEQLAGLPIEVIKVCGSCRLFFGHREYPIFQVWNGIH